VSHILSKSTYLRGVKCEKSLHLHKYNKHLKDEISEDQEAKFRFGDKVGKLAQNLFPEGIDVTPENLYNYSKSLEQTKNAIKDGISVIYEASFQFDGVLCAVDILVRDGNMWNAYEVKSSTSVKETHITDASVQYHVMKNCGIEIKDISIIVIDNNYQKQGNIEVEKLFKIESVYDDVLSLQAQVKNNIVRLKEVLSSKQEPKEFIGAKCSKPYDCDFIGHCWKDVPKYSIFNLANIRKTKAEQLYHSGVTLITDLPYDHRLTSSQAHQVQCERDGLVIINKKKLRSFTDALKFPLYFLDFETTQMGIPQFEKQKPYQQIPFQYSLHVQNNENSEVLHHEFLAKSENKDPRLNFINSLISDCGSNGSILVYNIGFERAILNQLIKDFPEYESQIQAIIGRLLDLMAPFQKKHYYTPEMRGSYSVKNVLPALCPELSYQDLDIKGGGAASRVFGELLSGEFTGDVQLTRTHLLEYCKLDTWAMVKLLEKIHEVI
jgi:predicted RecB family nuclease